MAIWKIVPGKLGEYESKFLTDKKIYLTWGELDTNLSKFKDKPSLKKFLLDHYENQKKGTIRSWLGQVWPFAKEFKIGDWVVIPSKLKSAIHIGEIIGDYKFDQKAKDPFYHSRSVKWIATDIPRSNFDQDILYSIGAFNTVCKISRNDAEERIRKMANNNWKSTLQTRVKKGNSDREELSIDFEEERNFESDAKDQIAKFLIRKFKGHGMEIIIEAILKAKGYTTYRSPEGQDKSKDILAAPEPMGFGRPRICVQVKTGDTPIDREQLTILNGAMQNFGADQGLLVSWSGFKSSIYKEVPNQFFKVRLWEQKQIIDELLLNYDKLEENIKAELPLKRIWTLSLSEEE